MSEIFSDEQFDLIILNLVLHHFVGSTYRESKKNALESLGAVGKLLSKDGRIFVCEHIYNGLIVDSLASRLIYRLTSIQNPFIAKLFRKFGANTAGTGVCFQSLKMWHRAIRHAGLVVVEYQGDPPKRLQKVRRFVLHVKSRFLGYFWLSEKEDKATAEGVEKLTKVA